MDRQDAAELPEFDVGELDLPPEPPADTGGLPDRNPGPLVSGVKNSHLFTFVTVLFAALELQAIFVLMGTADGGGAEAMTWAFGGIFLLTVFAWFIGGMLWFNKKFDAQR